MLIEGFPPTERNHTFYHVTIFSHMQQIITSILSKCHWKKIPDIKEDGLMKDL